MLRGGPHRGGLPRPVPLAGGVLGCVSCAVVYHTLNPTLVLNVRLKEAMPEGSCRLQATQLLRHVLFPTDFSEISAARRRLGDPPGSPGPIPGHGVARPGRARR